MTRRARGASPRVVTDYAVVVDPATLRDRRSVRGRDPAPGGRHVGPVRLIDNAGMVLEAADEAGVAETSVPSSAVTVS